MTTFLVAAATGLMAAAVPGKSLPDASQTASPGGLAQGLYVERSADGRATCHNPRANRLVVHVLPAPPHPHSANIGEISYRLGGKRNGFTLSARPALSPAGADGTRRVRFAGGRPDTPRAVVDGVPDSVLEGRFSGEGRLNNRGDLELRELRYQGPPLRPGESGVHVEAGRLPGQDRALRAFAYCGDGRL